MSAVHVEYIYTKDEAHRARREVVRAISPAIRYLPYVLILGVLVGIAHVWDDELPWFVLPLVIIFYSVIIWRALAKNRRVREEAFEKSPDANNPVRWTIDADGVELRGVNSETKLKWSGYVRVRETDLGFLFYFQARLAHWLPKSGFKSESDIDTVRNWIQEKSIPYKRV